MTSGTQPSNENGNRTAPRTKICVFCGASAGKSPAHIEAARELGRVMAANNIDLGESFGTADKRRAQNDQGMDVGADRVARIPHIRLAEESLPGVWATWLLNREEKVTARRGLRLCDSERQVLTGME